MQLKKKLKGFGQALARLWPGFGQALATKIFNIRFGAKKINKLYLWARARAYFV